MNLTGKDCNKTQAIAIRLVRKWMTEIPPGDAILICCESVAADKQYRVWKKWFAKHEDLEVSTIDSSKSILISLPMYVSSANLSHFPPPCFNSSHPVPLVPLSASPSADFISSHQAGVKHRQYYRRPSRVVYQERLVP